MTAYLDQWEGGKVPFDKLPADMAIRESHNTPKPIARVVSVETTADGMTIEARPWCRCPEAGHFADCPEFREAKLDLNDVAGQPNVFEGTAAPVTIIEGGQYKQSPEALTRRAAEIAAAKGREFTPVPKPVRKARPKR